MAKKSNQSVAKQLDEALRSVAKESADATTKLLEANGVYVSDSFAAGLKDYIYESLGTTAE